jgi:uncharacterized membrane protein YfcA
MSADSSHSEILGSPSIRHGQWIPWLLWAFGFLAAWALLVIANGGAARVAAHWPISVAMALGSYIAGSTPMGGGTIGFPVLVLFFDQPADFGREFSFLIQSIGMTSASIFILCSRRTVAWGVLPWAAGASALSLVATHYWLFPLVSDAAVKLTFAGIWGGFGVVTLVKLRQLLAHHHAPTLGQRSDMLLGVAGGLIGGVASGLTGVGVDMVVYTLLVLVYRADLRAAISTSVILMAWNSLVGTLLTFADGGVEPEVFSNWMAASPIVLLGAPFGAWVMTRIRRGPTLLFVSTLCILQLVWTLSRVEATPPILLLMAAAVVGLNVLFHLLYAYGRRLRPDLGEQRPGILDG